MDNCKTTKRKAVIIGVGAVGASCAFALINSALCDELVLIDIDKKRVLGEAEDLNHGMAFCSTATYVYSGDYSDCRDANAVIITAGVANTSGESRLSLAKRNARILDNIIPKVISSGFNGVFIIATNPVDVMSAHALKISSVSPDRIIGTGTLLDTARLRFMLGEYFKVAPNNVHAYVMGEHGDSELVAWSGAMLGTKPLTEICIESNCYSMDDLHIIEENVRNMGQSIIELKGLTCYGIGMTIMRLLKAILTDEHSVLTVSAYLNGEYGQSDVFAGIPCVISACGISERIETRLSGAEQQRFDSSCEIIRGSIKSCIQADHIYK